MLRRKFATGLAPPYRFNDIWRPWSPALCSRNLCASAAIVSCQECCPPREFTVFALGVVSLEQAVALIAGWYTKRSAPFANNFPGYSKPIGDGAGRLALDGLCQIFIEYERMPASTC